LNSQKTADFVQANAPDVVLIFGSKLIKDPLFSALPKNTINLHLGISPRYRGAATLFWPFYFMEPTYAGSTFHFIVSEPDAGAIIHQVLPKLVLGDKIHDVACKTIIDSAQDAVTLLAILNEKGSWKVHTQKATGKNFLESDFRPEHLRIIYTVFNDDMVDQYLQGSLKCKQPTLARQW
jgi:methionyl-tRNA formyltransferase